MMIMEIHVHTCNQLLIIYNTCTIIKNIDLGKDVRFIFCDISKAFDRVWQFLNCESMVFAEILCSEMD
jgi:hypothetical protein